MMSKKKILITAIVAAIGVAVVTGIVAQQKNGPGGKPVGQVVTSPVAGHNGPIMPPRGALTPLKGSSARAPIGPYNGKIVPLNPSVNPLAKEAPGIEAAMLVSKASHGEAVPVSTFAGPDGMVEVIYRAQGVLSASGKPVYGTAWAMPKQGIVGLGEAIDANGNLLSTPGANFALNAVKNPAVQGTSNSTSPSAATASTASGNGATTPNVALVDEETAALLHGEAVPAAAVAPGMSSNPGLLAAALTPLNSFIEGENGPVVTVFATPDSRKAWHIYKNTHVAVKTGDMRIRWVPIGTGARSLAVSESILSAPNPEKSWALNFQSFNSKTRAGLVPGENNVEMEEEVDGNTEILARMGQVRTLEAFYCDQKSAKAVQIPEPVTSEGLQKVLKMIGTDCG